MEEFTPPLALASRRKITSSKLVGGVPSQLGKLTALATLCAAPPSPPPAASKPLQDGGRGIEMRAATRRGSAPVVLAALCGHLCSPCPRPVALAGTLIGGGQRVGEGRVPPSAFVSGPHGPAPAPLSQKAWQERPERQLALAAREARCSGFAVSYRSSAPSPASRGRI
eukprot:scaffold50084_cov87-Phaeocystis_antarctica.AAC.2